jgi:signal transduction histidine kinase
MLNSDVKAVREAMNSMVIEGQLIFTALGRRENAAAGRHMAAMDRQLVSVNAALLRLREHIASAQKEHFAEQQARAASLQTFEYLIAAAIVIMVGGATFYGIKIARQVEEQGRERERSNLELEKRVRERTTDLVTANEALRTSEQSRARLLRQVMSAQEDERRRISRDLHDGIGQSLTSLLIGLRTLEGAESQETVHGRTAELRALVADTLEEVRRLARGLRPSVLDDLGLAAALERLTTDYSQAHGIAVALDLGESAGSRLPALVETALYRIVQEALTNTAKHAAAKNVNIALRHDPAAVQMTITDDGQGFDMTASSSRTGGHFGLSSIKERARLLSGTASVVSRTGQGTTITVRIPLTEVADGEDSRAVGG